MAHQAAAEDKKFVRTFEAFGIAPDAFDHRAHIRLAYTYLCAHDAEVTYRKVRLALCSFLSHLGVQPSSKYHDTITRAWVLAVRHFMAVSSDATSADEFIDANPRLLDSAIMLRHYSKRLLFSDSARHAFVEPDLLPIPRYD